MGDLIGDDGQRAPDFERLWKIWPKRANKKKAIEQWSRISEGLKSVIIADAEKRDRQKYWAFFPVMQLVTYLKDERYTDEWEDELAALKRREGGTHAHKPPEAYVPIPDVALPPQERTINLAFRNYVVMALHRGGVPDVDSALRHKKDVLRDVWPALDEDVNSGGMSRGDALREIADVFLDRMDQTYGYGLRERVWSQMGRAA